MCLQLIMTAWLPTFGLSQMDAEKRKTLRDLLRKMSKTGFIETLEFICRKRSVHYAEILNYNLENEIVKSRATVTLIIRNLVKMSLIERSVLDSRPVRTIYEPTEKGLKLIRHLQEIQRL